MTRRLLAPAILAGALVLAAGPMFAHHGTAAFDLTKTVTVKGIVTDFQFINPHVEIYWNSESDKGVAEKWQGELTAPTKLTRAGWSKHTLKVGDPITVSGNPAKSGEHTIWVRKLIGPTGESLQLAED